MSGVRPRGNSFITGAFISSTIDDLGLDLYSFRVYMHLCRRIGDEMRVWESAKKMAVICGISESKVRESIRFLEKIGLIELEPQYREDGSQTTNNIFVIGLGGLKHPKPCTTYSPPLVPPTTPPCTTYRPKGIPVKGNPISKEKEASASLASTENDDLPEVPSSAQIEHMGRQLSDNQTLGILQSDVRKLTNNNTEYITENINIKEQGASPSLTATEKLKWLLRQSQVKTKDADKEKDQSPTLSRPIPAPPQKTKSNAKPPKPPKQPRPRDLLMDSIALACYDTVEDLPPSSWKLIASVAKELREVRVEPSDIGLLVAWMKKDPYWAKREIGPHSLLRQVPTWRKSTRAAPSPLSEYSAVQHEVYND